MDGLSSICAGLGTLEEDENGNRVGYAKGEYCSDNLKDLLRYLRRDDPEKRDVFKQVCKWNIVGKDLVPIIEYCQEERNLVLNAVKVLVFLTMPIEPTSVDIPQQIDYLWGLKSAITYSHAVPVIVSLLESPLENLENESFTEDDWKLVQLILTLFRNFLAIQDISTQQKAGGAATQFLSLRDRFLELLFQENVMDLILALSQHTGGSHGYLRQDNLLLLEIFYYIFKGQEPELIAKTYLKDPKVVKAIENSVTSLESIIKEEQEKRNITRLHNLSCYSQFSGTFTRVSLDGTKAPFKGNPCSSSGEALLKAHKHHRGPSKRTIWDRGELPSTKIQILELLYEFISQFLTGGYNALMQSVREDIEKEHQEIQGSDVITFFQVARFVISFQYHKCLTSKSCADSEKEASGTFHDDNTSFRGSICGPVAETLNESMFLMVISKWRFAFEGLKQTNDYKFLSAAGSLIKTMIRMLDLVLKESLEDSKEPQTARVLLYKLFYDQTEEGMTPFLLSLIKSFDAHKQPKSDLADLVESIHVILRLMENLQARGTLRVSKKARKKKSKKSATNNEDICEPSVDVTTQNTVGTSPSEESADANMLDKGTIGKQDVGDKGGSIGGSTKVDEPSNAARNELELEDKNVGYDNYPATDNSSDDEQLELTNEVDFKASSLVSALANNTIIQKLCWLLKFYKSNSFSTNHYIISMFRKICDDLELSPMLYQLSLLTIFYEILEEQKAQPSKEYENIVTFLTSFVRKMLRKMKSYPLLFVEVLFWKTRKECHHINCGYMLNDLKSIWNKYGEGENGTSKNGSSLSEGQKWTRRSIADALGDDDFVETHWEDQKEDDQLEENFQGFRLRTAREESTSILDDWIDESEDSLGERHSIADAADTMSNRGKDHVLDVELESKIRDLYEKYKGNADCCHLIANELEPNGDISKLQISVTLKKLGFRVPSKKTNSFGVQKTLGDRNGNLSKSTTNNAKEENASLTKPMHSRKRVHAFSLDQEQKIRDLFEQFKDHRRCSYMIATALDSTGKISAAQVTRKLKQFGLFVPKKKKSNEKIMKNDEFSNVSSEAAGASDDETLLSLKNRGKHNQNGSRTLEKPNQKTKRKFSEDMSDEELLSVLVKTKKKTSKSDEVEPQTDSIEKNLDENNSDGMDVEMPERDDIVPANQPVAGEMDTEIANHSINSRTETNGRDSPNSSDVNSSVNSENPQNLLYGDELQDELADESADPINTTQENSVSRRRLRMVIDFDDDDE